MKNNNYKLPSNRSFGVVFFIIFFLIGIYPLLKNGDIKIWFIIISIVFLILGILNSKILYPLNKIWMKIGYFLGMIVAPLIIMLIYFGIVTPTGFLMRILNKDLLNLKKDRNKKTYWIHKENSKNSMKNQF